MINTEIYLKPINKAYCLVCVWSIEGSIIKAEPKGNFFTNKKDKKVMNT